MKQYCFYYWITHFRILTQNRMKKISLFISAITLSIVAFAQIPNAGFETWNSMGAYENPDGWATLNDYTALASVFTATKGTPGSPGSSFIKLTSKTVGPTVVNGIAVSGVLDVATQQPVSGFPMTSTPAALTGKWQHMVAGSSQGSISATLTRWDATMGMRMVVATANVTLSGMAMSWANFSIPFNYVDSQAPDSCIIVMKASGSNPTNSDYLWVDNLAFSGSVAAVSSYSALTAIEVGPNPASDLLKVTVTATKSTSIEGSLVASNGQVMYSFSNEIVVGSNELQIAVDQYPAGSYMLLLTSSEGTVTKRFVIE
jgi:hypothetical protein